MCVCTLCACWYMDFLLSVCIYNELEFAILMLIGIVYCFLILYRFRCTKTSVVVLVFLKIVSFCKHHCTC